MSGSNNPPVRFYVYILQCADGFYYTGHTDKLGKRVEAQLQVLKAGEGWRIKDYCWVRSPKGFHVLYIVVAA